MEAYCVTFQKTWKVGGKRILRDNLWWSAIFWDSLTNNLPQCSFQANLPYLLLFWKFPECLLHCSTFLIVSLDWFVYMFISVTFLGALLGQGLCVCVCVCICVCWWRLQRSQRDTAMLSLLWHHFHVAVDYSWWTLFQSYIDFSKTEIILWLYLQTEFEQDVVVNNGSLIITNSTCREKCLMTITDLKSRYK